MVAPAARTAGEAHAAGLGLPECLAAAEAAAADLHIPLNALVAAIDHLRVQQAAPPNLASAIRTWILGQFVIEPDGKDANVSH